MKKFIKNSVISLSTLLACSCVAFADGNAFTPLNFDDTAYGIRTSATAQQVAPISATANTDAVGNSKMQNAITQLDNAQVEVRNELLNYKTKYSEIDAKYTAIKAERKALSKQVKSLERRINKIDKQKENIRKNMI